MYDDIEACDSLELVEDIDITPNVARACELDNERRVQMITDNVHAPLQAAFLNFAGVTDGRPGIHADFVNGVTEYRLFVFNKRA